MNNGRVERELQWAAWMDAAQSGDRAAYERLLVDLSKAVRARVRRRLRNHDDAEDVVQEVLLTVHRVRHTYDPSRPFMPWLAAIIDRRTVDLFRRQGRQQRNETLDDDAAVTFPDPGANHSLDADDAKAELASMLRTLPPGQRQALELLKVQELSLREAAAGSGISETALKVAVHRALKTLRARLAAYRGKSMEPT